MCSDDPQRAASSQRLFVAAELSSSAQDRLTAYTQHLRGAMPWQEQVRWTRPEGRHLTLAFLGQTSRDRGAAVVTALDAVARHQAPLQLRLQDAGAFPSLRRARVLWVGVVDDDSRLAALVTDLQAELRAVDIPAEARPFRGHVTLGRVTERRGLDLSGVAAIPFRPAEPFPVQELVLFQSILEPQGARYTPLHRAPLG